MDIKVDLRNNAIPPILYLKILCPPFWALLVSLGSWLLESFAIMPLCLNMSGAKVVVNKSWYYCDIMASLLFANYNPSCPHVPIREGIRTERIELHEVRCSERKHSPSSFLVNSPFAANKTKK